MLKEIGEGGVDSHGADEFPFGPDADGGGDEAGEGADEPGVFAGEEGCAPASEEADGGDDVKAGLDAPFHDQCAEGGADEGADASEGVGEGVVPGGLGFGRGGDGGVGWSCGGIVAGRGREAK